MEVAASLETGFSCVRSRLAMLGDHGGLGGREDTRGSGERLEWFCMIQYHAHELIVHDREAEHVIHRGLS